MCVYAREVLNVETDRPIHSRREPTNLLAAAALSFELGAVTSANSHPVVPFVGFETAEGCCSTAENHH